jgi:hypothetical protein
MLKNYLTKIYSSQLCIEIVCISSRNEKIKLMFEKSYAYNLF